MDLFRRKLYAVNGAFNQLMVFRIALHQPKIGGLGVFQMAEITFMSVVRGAGQILTRLFLANPLLGDCRRNTKDNYQVWLRYAVGFIFQLINPFNEFRSLLWIGDFPPLMADVRIHIPV